LAEIYNNREITHIDASFAVDNTTGVATMLLFSMFLELENISPCIDGDLVVQGVILSATRSPAICKISFSSDGDSFVEVATVYPWQMMVTLASDPDGQGTFAIPVSLGSEFREGLVKVQVYVDEPSRVPYGEEDESYQGKLSEGLTCALEYTTSAILGSTDFKQSREEISEEIQIAANSASLSGDREMSAVGGVGFHASGEESTAALERDSEGAAGAITGSHSAPHHATSHSVPVQSRQIIHSIKIAIDYDELSSLRSEGYELCCVQLTENGPVEDQEHLWRFHVMVMYGPIEEGGLEDLVWLNCPKALGTLPVLRDYEILHDTDLTEPSDNVLHLL
jgi:hypothetical protein